MWTKRGARVSKNFTKIYPQTSKTKHIFMGASINHVDLAGERNKISTKEVKIRHKWFGTFRGLHKPSGPIKGVKKSHKGSKGAFINYVDKILKIFTSLPLR